jgi:hypothetical protein
MFLKRKTSPGKYLLGGVRGEVADMAENKRVDQ